MMMAPGLCAVPEHEPIILLLFNKSFKLSQPKVNIQNELLFQSNVNIKYFCSRRFSNVVVVVVVVVVDVRTQLL